MKDERAEAHWRAFADANGFQGAALSPLPSDASFRRYCRLLGGPRPALIMDAPVPHENLPAYLKVRDHLASLGLRVPAVYERAPEAGLALIEDFGDGTFTNRLTAGDCEADLYDLAVDSLVHLHTSAQAVRIDVPAYDMETLLEEASRFTDWYVPAVTGAPVCADARRDYLAVWRAALEPVSGLRETLVLRDYLVDNIMVVPGATPVARCGLLDFQDALIGARAYDLVSLLEDARRDVSAAVAARSMERYVAGMDGRVSRTELERDMRLLGAQRHVKVMGIFVRLARRDGKKGYLKHIPRLQRLLVSSLESRLLEDVRRVIGDICPAWDTVSESRFERAREQ